MEEESKKKNLLSLFAVVASIVGTMALLGYFCIRFLPSEGTAAYSNDFNLNQRASAPMEQAAANWHDDTGALVHQPMKTKYILHKDIQKKIGRSLITYRGKTGGSKFKLDVVVLDLDPEVTYRRKLDISKAKESFRAGEERFELVSAGRLRLHAWHYH